MTQISLEALQKRLSPLGLDGFLVPKMDPYRWEDTAPSDNFLQALTGFTGSAGLACVLEKKAAVCVDGRYTLQVRQEVDAMHYAFLNYSLEQLAQWIAQTLDKTAVIGYDPWLHSVAEIDHLRKVFEGHEIQLKAVPENPLVALWTERPAATPYPIDSYQLEYAGKSVAEKLHDVRTDAQKAGVAGVLLNTPDSVSWLLNLRCPARPIMPGVEAYVYIPVSGKVSLFVDPTRLKADLEQVCGVPIEVQALDQLAPFLQALGAQTIWGDAQEIPQMLVSLLEKGEGKFLYRTNPCLLPKSCKNAAEISGARLAQSYDGAALSNCLAWIQKNIGQRPLWEQDIADQLLVFRQQQPLFQSPSFTSIVGSGPNGAIIHYHPTAETNRQLQPTDMLLIDSGGQYLGGTTDTTRTISLNQAPTLGQKRHFTAVLKGHIALACARFPEGVAGHQLDALARQYLWQIGVDYAHGTGHGVGSYLGVHEGPQRISSGGFSVPLKPGMICSNEPGYYEPGAYGIRIESLILIVTASGTDLPANQVVSWASADNQAQSILGFETLTMVPIDLSLVLLEALSPLERQWLNAYHEKVFKTLSPLVLPETVSWLREATRAL